MKKIFLLIFTAAGLLYPQELDATVTVNYEKLPIVNKEYLVDVQQIIEDYLNQTQFTGTYWDGEKIPCSFNIFFTSASDQFTYSAQVVVRSSHYVYNHPNKRSPMLAVNDPSWSFKFDKNEARYYQPNYFNPFLSFLDYYALVIIGLELEAWEAFSGNDAFNTAYGIVQLAQTGSFSKGWGEVSGTYSRRDLIASILNDRYRPFREAFSDYMYGVDLIENGKKKEGQEMIVKLIDVVKELRGQLDIRGVYLSTFFDAKSGEIIDYLADYPDKSIWKTLQKVDPPRMSKYIEME